MILLLGGTSETAPLAMALAEAGHKILVSTATGISLDVGSHPGISRRTGALDEGEMDVLIHECQIKAIVDATHPFATQVSAMARKVARGRGIPYLQWVRPSSLQEKREPLQRDGESPQWDGEPLQENVEIWLARNHQEAASLAFSPGRPVFLTTGSRNLTPYVQESRRVGIPIVVRVLPNPDSLEACRLAGVQEGSIVTGRGPFSVEENRAVIRRFGIGVIVTKDSGLAGGVQEKIEAARAEGCQVVVVRRPDQDSSSAFHDIEDLAYALSASLKVEDRASAGKSRENPGEH